MKQHANVILFLIIHKKKSTHTVECSVRQDVTVVFAGYSVTDQTFPADGKAGFLIFAKREKWYIMKKIKRREGGNWWETRVSKEKSWRQSFQKVLMCLSLGWGAKNSRPPAKHNSLAFIGDVLVNQSSPKLTLHIWIACGEGPRQVSTESLWDERPMKNLPNLLCQCQTPYFAVTADGLMEWMIEVWRSKSRVINTIQDIQLTATLWKQDHWINICTHSPSAVSLQMAF